ASIGRPSGAHPATQSAATTIARFMCSPPCREVQRKRRASRRRREAPLGRWPGSRTPTDPRVRSSARESWLARTEPAGGPSWIAERCVGDRRGRASEPGDREAAEAGALGEADGEAEARGLVE